MAVISNYSCIELFTFDFADILLDAVKNISREVMVNTFSAFLKINFLGADSVNFHIITLLYINTLY